MSQYFTDFVADTVGAQPASWSERWYTGAGDSLIVNAGIPSGGGTKALRMALSETARYALSWDVPGTPSGDVEVVARMYHSSTTTSVGRRRLFLHGAGTTASTGAYFAEEQYASSFQLRKYVSGTVTTLDTGAAMAPGWQWIRLQRSGTTVRARTWAEGSSEPATWEVEATDSSLSSGWVGVGSYAGGVESVIFVDRFGVGTGGDPAPTAPLVVPAPSVPNPLAVPESVLTGHRAGEGYRVDVLDRRGGVRAEFGRVLGGSIEHNINRVISGGGSLTLVKDPAIDVDWLSDRLRVWWVLGDHAWPLGTFLPSRPRESTSFVVESGSFLPSWDVTLLDTLTVLAEDVVPETLSLPAGAVATDEIQSIIEGAGEVAAVTSSAETLLSPLVWPAGTTKLRVVNDLLSAINYFSLRADPFGRLTAEPYAAPMYRTVVRRFRPGAAAVHLADMAREEDVYGVPNRVICRTTGDGETEGLVSVAEDTGDGRFSYAARGRWISAVHDGIEATSQGVLDAIASRRLLDAQQVAAKIELQHAVVPLAGNDVVGIEYDGAMRMAVVQSLAVDLAPGALTRCTLLEVMQA